VKDGVPKAELHVHLEGTAAPDLVRRLAARNDVHLPPELFRDDDSFEWRDFSHFLTVYDMASGVIKTPEDYRDVTFEYLARCAAEGVVYAELMSSPDHAAAGMSYEQHLDGIVAGIEDARAEHGIEGYVIVTCVRHFGVAQAEAVARQVVDNPHARVIGFGMGGDELGFPPAQFAGAFAIAHDAGLATTVHAGEFGAPAAIREALASLPVRRLGHGVRAAEHPALVAELADRGIVLECCPTSNVATGVFADYAHHPFVALRDAGCRVTLNSDDPPYFHTSVGREYDVARRHFGLDDGAPKDVTRTAIEAGFAPREARDALMARHGL